MVWNIINVTIFNEINKNYVFFMSIERIIINTWINIEIIWLKRIIKLCYTNVAMYGYTGHKVI